MRVAIRLNFSPLLSGGVEQYCEGLARGLRDLEGDDEWVFVAGPEHEALLRPYLGGPLTWVRVGTAGRARWRQVRSAMLQSRPGQLAARVKHNVHPRDIPTFDPDLHAGCDVVHFPTQGYERTALPSLYQPWDLQHRWFPELFAPDVISRREHVYSEGCRSATFVVVASRFVRDDVVAAYGVDERRVAVVPPGVPLMVKPPSPDAEPEPFALFPARAWPHKNHLRLMEAVAILHRRGVRVRLSCPGGPRPHLDAVRDEVKRLGLEGSVHFPGYLSPAELAGLFARARMLIFPSLFEGFGFPVLEAFAAGLPVACSGTTSLPELAADAALLFDPMDAESIAGAFERLWADRELREQLRASGYERASLYGWDRLARSCRALYRSAAGEPLAEGDAQSLIAAGIPV